MDDQWKAGLEDVIAARSAVCAIDGAAGRLFYRGYEIGELAGAVPFEDVARFSSLGVPEPHGGIVAAAGQQLAVGRIGDGLQVAAPPSRSMPPSIRMSPTAARSRICASRSD